jgi:tryptophan synthase alpha chain
MKRIEELFERKNNNILNVYCTAGFPTLTSTIEVMKSLQESGADMIELGIPYSDPLADGPVIQASSTVALQNGMTIKKLFEQLNNFRTIIQLPVLLMGYMNPILQYGFENFCADAAAVGIDGLILPDLPEYEFESEYGKIINNYGLDFVFLVTPETTEARVKRLDQLSSGFLYAVSSSSTTGKEKKMEDVTSYLATLKNFHLKNPILVGFGIRDRQSFQAACQAANGAIIGTAYIKVLNQGTDVKSATKQFLSGILY